VDVASILLNSWVFNYECMECMECNWNRVSTRDISCSCRVYFPFCGLIPPQASCDLFFLDFKRGVRLLFVLHLKIVKSEIAVRPIRSSLISLKRGGGALFLLGAGLYTILTAYIIIPSHGKGLSSSNSSVLYLRASSMMHCGLGFKYHNFSFLVVSSTELKSR